MNGKIKYILTCFTVFTIAKTMITYMKDFFISLINEDSNNPIINVMFAIVFLMFFVSFRFIEPTVRQSYENAWFVLLPILFIRFIVVIILSVPLLEHYVSYTYFYTLFLQL